MTIRKSILVSLALHLLLLGTGLAFARYAGGLFQTGHEPIVVMLLGKGGTSPEQLQPGKGQPQRTSSRQKKVRPAGQAPRKTAKIPDTVPVRSESRIESAQPARVEQEQGRSTGENAASGSDEGNGRPASAGSEAGSVSSEQWAVIVSSIERVKSYPRFARERGIEGVVRLRFRLKPQGDVEKVEIVKSSGYDILDSASVRTVYRAGPLPYVSGWVEVPIAYVLK